MASFEGINGAMANELNQLSDADKRELQQFIQNESQKASIQESQCTCLAARDLRVSDSQADV